MYAENQSRNSYRHQKIASNPTMCTACFKQERCEGKKLCSECLDVSKAQYVKHREYYKQKRKADVLVSPKRNIARMVTFAKKRAGGNITTDDVFSLWVQSDGCCALSGIKMTWGGGKISPNTLSLDRIDPSRGYFSGNVRLVCHSINAFRQQMSDEDVLKMAKAIVLTLESKRSAEKVLKEIA
jgi:hypothetical protein